MKNSRKITVIIAGGGSGGHLFPGVAIAQELEKKLKNCQIYFLGSRFGIEAQILANSKYSHFLLPISGLYRVGWKKKCLGLFRFAYSFLYSILLILRVRPDLIVGVGGYASSTAVSVGILLRKNVVIQEQNISPGMTNRILGKYVKLAFVPFSGMEKYFANPIVVGNPIRQEVLAVVPYQKNDQITLLIIGGSQGSHAINMACIEALPALSSLKDKLRILHQTGQKDFEKVQESYKQYPQIESEVFAFTDNMAELYNQSHLLLCRSGSIIHEVITVGRAMLLVPFPNASGDHQLKNAEYIVKNKAGILLEQNNNLSQNFTFTLQKLLQNPLKIESMARKAKSLAVENVAEKIANKICLFYHIS